MNGQQLTNSSNSANGTPSSSYPASLSSQSSRDPSPGAPRKPFTESYNHVISPQANHWPKEKSNALLSGLVDSRPSPNFASAAASNPTPPPTSTLTHQPNPETQGLQTLGTQPAGASVNQSNLPSSQPNPVATSPIQPMYRFPPPTSLPHPHPSSVGLSTSLISHANHHSQSGSLSNQFPTPVRTPVRPTSSSAQTFDFSRSTSSHSQQPHQSMQSTQLLPNPLRSTQSPLQQPNVPIKSSILPEQPKSTQVPLQQPPLSMQSTQLPPNSSRSTQSPLQQPYPPTMSSQLPEATRSTQSPPQQPLLSTQPLEPSKLTQNQPSQHPFQSSTGSQFLPNSNQFQKPFQQQPNQFQKFPAVQTPQSNQVSQLPGQSSQRPPQVPLLQNKSSQPVSQTAQPPNQNQYQQPQNQYGQPPNQFFNAQPQMSQHTSQFPHPPSQTFLPPNQISHSSGQFPQQTPGQPVLPPMQYNASVAVPHQQFQSAGHPQPLQSQQLPTQFNKRYPQMPQQPGLQQQFGTVDGLTPHMAGLSVNQGFNKLWGMDTVDLLKCRDLLPKEKLEPPPVRLQHELYEAANCSPEIFRCTLTKIPETKSLLDKSRLPLGVLIHPFKDLNERTGCMEEASILEHWPQQKISKQLSVIQCTVIVRCRVCRTYINPFVYFVDNKRWKCNLCFRVNELPDEFQFDPMTKTYGDPSRRPEIKSATIEFIAPSEYMVRPPQPAIYVFVLDVSRLACESGYLDAVCRTLLAELDNVPGDARTCIAFITFDSTVHFYSLTEGQGQPHQMIVVDIEDMFLPTPDNLLVSLNECRDLIRDLLQELPNKYRESYDTHSALGAALQAAYKLLAPTGGRVTVFQACLPNVGPGALSVREDPSQRAGDNPPHLNPATDFYKKLALDCSGQQIAVDLFLVNSQYLDLATISGVSRFSGGCMHHIPLYRSDKPLLVDSLERMFQRYLTRKIGFESVMRLRCTRGLSIHTFHGNFFVRSTDLLSLPNANPDAGFGMQVTIDENLAEVQNVCFQAALLYTSSKGERRIRVHTLCLPVVSNLADVMHGADQQCIVGLLSKMAVDRAIQSSLSDAREAFVNVVADVLSAFKLTQSGNTTGCLLAPASLRLLPLYILALLKHMAFRVGQSTRLDDRVFAMCQMKSLPLAFLMQSVYPDLYSLLKIEQQPEIEVGDETVPQPPRLQLSAERVDSFGLYLLDDGTSLMLYVGHNLDPTTCQAVFSVPHFSAIPQDLYSLPELDNPTSKALRNFVTHLQNEKPYPTPLQVVRDDSHHRMRFLERLIEDKNESGTSYYEFLQSIKSLMK